MGESEEWKRESYHALVQKGFDLNECVQYQDRYVPTAAGIGMISDKILSNWVAAVTLETRASSA